MNYISYGIAAVLALCVPCAAAAQIRSATGTVVITAEVRPPTECADGADNDLDGFIDYPADAGCESFFDEDEVDGEQGSENSRRAVAPSPLARLVSLFPSGVITPIAQLFDFFAPPAPSQRGTDTAAESGRAPQSPGSEVFAPTDSQATAAEPSAHPSASSPISRAAAAVISFFSSLAQPGISFLARVFSFVGRVFEFIF